MIIKTDKPTAVFLLEADRDYLIARLINFAGAAFASRSGYFSQQALEKYLKAFSVQEAQEYLKTHDLLELAKHCSKFHKDLSNKKFIENLKIFNAFIDLGRYGGEASHDPYSKKTKNVETASIILWQASNIKILDLLVFTIRSKLDFERIRFDDSLKSIQKKNKKSYFVKTWKLPIKLRDILIIENNYFN